MQQALRPGASRTEGVRFALSDLQRGICSGAFEGEDAEFVFNQTGINSVGKVQSLADLEHHMEEGDTITIGDGDFETNCHPDVQASQGRCQGLWAKHLLKTSWRRKRQSNEANEMVARCSVREGL